MASITGLLQQSAQAQASRSRHPSPAINKTAVPRASSVPSSHFSTASAEASSAVQGCATRNRLRVAADGAAVGQARHEATLPKRKGLTRQGSLREGFGLPADMRFGP
jgi:hypothetical protein